MLTTLCLGMGFTAALVGFLASRVCSLPDWDM